MSSRSSKAKNATSRRVYSTDGGRTCPGCLRPQAECVCATTHATLAPSGDGIVRLHRETKGRKGKGVTLVRGLDLPPPELAALAKALKSACGVGGSVKDAEIELQTSDRDKLKGLLEARGFSVKLAGG